MQQKGVYKFDPIRLAEVHQECQQAVKNDMTEGINLIIVSNTFTTNREIAPYRLLAAQYQYRLCVITVEHGMLPPTALAERNAHNVSAETIQRMADRWEQFHL